MRPQTGWRSPVGSLRLETWRGDVRHFERSGAQGTLTLAAQRAELVIKLGFLMGAFAPMIEAKVAEKMKKVFAAQ